VTQCSVVVGYQRIGEPCYIHHHPEDRRSTVIQNVSNL
jgi:hypothetical protein